MDLLRDLCSTFSPSGSEDNAIAMWDVFCSNVGATKCYSDKIKNSGWSLGTGSTKIMVSGHIDEVSARVQEISSNGLISIINTGGIDGKALVSSEVVLLGDKGNVLGYIGKKPIHLEHRDEMKIDNSLETLKVDVGAKSNKEVEEMGIRVGTFVVYSRRYEEIGLDKDTIVATGLDDKVGVYISAEILKRLSTWPDNSWKDKYTVVAVACTQEEVGGRGATLAAMNINPDISIDFDVTHCSDSNGVSSSSNGDIKLGAGGVIEYGAEKSERINKLLREIPFNFQSASGRCGGTDTNNIQVAAKDCETALISIPNRNMHTSVEMVSKKDVEGIICAVVKLIVEKSL
jgi:tetrahedral aminopeptidase